MSAPMDKTLLAVNGTLMRGLELNPNLLAVGATFVREDETDACYRLWSIGDRHPAMLRTPGAGTRVALELWEVPAAGLATILQNEPPGLAIGKVVLKDGHGRARRSRRALPLRGAARDHRVRRLARVHGGAAFSVS